ncbi:MAG: histidine kinase, partial [Flavisolibacter sp.]
MDTQEATIFTALLISVPIVGVIIIIFIISTIRHQRKNLELQRLNILAEITTLETERARMSADLHDEMGPILSVIKFRIDSVDSVSEIDRLQLKEATNQIDEVIDRMRTIARDLLPSSLSRKGLKIAIQEYISVVSNIIPIQFHYDHVIL